MKFSREDVEFTSHGAALRGWLFRPEGNTPRPGIVMAHGFTAVREMFLDRYAEAFASAGFTTLVYDHFGFGASDGEPVSLRRRACSWRAIAMPSTGCVASPGATLTALEFGVRVIPAAPRHRRAATTAKRGNNANGKCRDEPGTDLHFVAAWPEAGQPRLLTVVSTQGIAASLVQRLEALSGYRHVFPPQDPHAALEPRALLAPGVQPGRAAMPRSVAGLRRGPGPHAADQQVRPSRGSRSAGTCAGRPGLAACGPGVHAIDLGRRAQLCPPAANRRRPTPRRRFAGRGSR